MEVLRTFEETRRRRTAMLLASAVTATLFAWSGFAWWLTRPGQPVDEALGVELPSGSRRIYEERVAVDSAAPFHAVYLSTTWSVDEAVAHFVSIANQVDPNARRYHLNDGTIVTIAPPEDVPATSLMPIQPVTEGIPLGTRCWIVLSRGVPPSATLFTAVPPDLGES